MKLPHKPLVKPLVLKGLVNGQLDKTLLAPVKCGGKMLKVAAEAFNDMYAHAKTDGITFRNIGDYRSYDAQLAMFLDRYDTKDEGRKPQVTRTYEGKTWYLKKGKSPSATPDPTGARGSNHGWGLAIDIAAEGKNGEIVSIGAHKKAYSWLLVNACQYGFYMQTANDKSPEFEAWHWQYCEGDAKPPYKQVVA